MKIISRRSSKILLAMFLVTIFAVAGNIGAKGASVTNVALNAEVTLLPEEGAFFDRGWGGGMVVDKGTIVDGEFLPKGKQWDQGAVWWDSNDGLNRYISIYLGGTFLIESFVVQCDDNDAYLLYYRDMITSTWVLAWDIPNYNALGWGMLTRPNPDDDAERYVLPAVIKTNALMFIGNLESGDNWFAVSEIQAFGTPYVPSGVPLFSNTLSILPIALLAGVFVIRKRRFSRVIAVVYSF